MKHKLVRILHCAVLLLLFLSVASCTSTRYATKSLAGVDFETASARFKMTLPVDGEKMTLKGSLKIKKGEMIQVSALVPMIRSEAARLEITPDRVLVIDRINKMYSTTSDVSQLDVLFGEVVDYQTLESLFTNNFAQLKRDKRFNKIKIELSNLVLNKTELKATTVSSKYTEVAFDELIKSLEGLQ